MGKAPADGTTSGKLPEFVEIASRSQKFELRPGACMSAGERRVALSCRKAIVAWGLVIHGPGEENHAVRLASDLHR